MKFYLVDDDSDVIDVMTAILEAAGHTVRSNVAGAYAVAEIAEDKPDCVLTDLVMAEMDGIELCRALRARRSLSQTKVVFVSARNSDYWRDRALDAGADGYLFKPIDATTFGADVERCLAGGDD